MREPLLKKYQSTRNQSIEMVRPLCAEQCRIQPHPEISPPWWNLAHTSWFFAKNLLASHGVPTEEDALFDYILNSYYASLGPRLEQHRRGLMTRPTMEEVHQYRESVDIRMKQLIENCSQEQWTLYAPLIEIGIQHELQHIELFYTEIKYILHQNPYLLRVPYTPLKKENRSFSREDLHLEKASAAQWIGITGGIHEFGNREGGWGWDNELPVHKYFLNDYSLHSRLVTNREYLDFMRDGGYENQLLWLNNGWKKAQEEKWKAPLYWELINGKWEIWTLSGMQPLNLDEPVCHVSFYEAEAYATWKKARLPSEREWEHAARLFSSKEGNFLNSGHLHPLPAPPSEDLSQLFGDVWEWTTSYYEPYPGYIPYGGVLAEYNEKFMDNQRVIRGGSCATDQDHFRTSYRNFWTPETRFQFTGIRLAR